MIPLSALAPAKVNLGLFVGEERARDGRHEIVSVMQSISLADELTLAPARAGARRDEIVAEGLEVPAAHNLAARALDAFRRASGWEHPPLRLELRKHVPVAAGLGGGSADAACVLRLCAAASGLADERLLHTIAATLGADVPAQLSPGRWLASGAGERLRALPHPGPELRVLVLPSEHELSTALVYARADELGARRSESELRRLREALEEELAEGRLVQADGALLENDLQPAAIALCPSIEGELELLRRAGAEHVMVSGSGPTVVGLLARASRLAGGFERVIEARAVGAAFGAVRPAGDGTVRHNLSRRWK